MKILITGGSGYLATSVSLLLSKKFKIVLCTRNPKKISKIKRKNINIVKISDYNINQIGKYIKGCDYIIHFVGLNKIDSNREPKKALNVKLRSTKALIYLANKYKIKKFIYISSMQVYKNYTYKKKITEDNTVTLASGYNKSHVMAERMILNSKKSFEYFILRPSSIFGFYFFSQSKELIYTILNNFCYQAKFENIIKISNPNTVRNFLPLTIFVKFINYILSNKIKSKNKIINIGYKSLSLKEVSKMIAKRYLIFNKSKIKILMKKKIKNKILKFIYTSNIKNLNFRKKIFENEIDNFLKNIKR